VGENLPWLFGAFAVGWALIFGYLFWIASKEKALRKQVAQLQKMLQDRGE
jgi:CcmD family protein